MVGAALMMNYLMSVGLRSFLPPNLVVWNILPGTPCRHVNVEFVCGFFTVVSLHSIPNGLYRIAKYKLNSLSLSKIAYSV